MNSYEKQLVTFSKEFIKHSQKLQQQKEKAYSKIFSEYIPVFETDPADIMKQFFVA